MLPGTGLWGAPRRRRRRLGGDWSPGMPATVDVCWADTGCGEGGCGGILFPIDRLIEKYQPRELRNTFSIDR